MIFLEKYIVQWYSGFTCFGYFYGCLQLSLFSAKTADVKNFCTKSVCTRRNSTKNTCAGAIFVTSVYIKITFIVGVCIERAQIGAISVRGTCVKITIFA